MNAEQLNGILARLHESHRKLQTMEKLQGVRGALEAVANNPADAALQNQYNANLQQLNDTLLAPELNNFTVRETKLIEELSLHVLVGEQLRAAISDAIVGIAITPRTAFDKIVVLHDKAISTLKKVNRVSSGLTDLGIDQGGPEPAEVELGLYIPRFGENLTLEQIVEEGEQLDTLVKVAYEAVEGRQHSPEVTYLTSCDYGYLLSVAGNVVMFLLVVIEKALDIRKKWADDRDHFKKSREMGHDDDGVNAMEAKQEAKRQQELADAIRKLVHEQTGPDEARKNEIVTLLTNSVKVFVEKHERGTYIDVRVGAPPDVPEKVEGAVENAELTALRAKAQLLERIEQASIRIHALEQNKEPTVRSIAAPAQE